MSAMQINEKRRRQQGKPMTMVYQGLMAQLMLLLLLLMLPLQAVHGQTPIDATSAPFSPITQAPIDVDSPVFSLTLAPIIPSTISPSLMPVVPETLSPTIKPTDVSPTLLPTTEPTLAPTPGPSMPPTLLPTLSPSVPLTTSPTILSTISPTSLIRTTSPTAFFGQVFVPSAFPSVAATSQAPIAVTVAPSTTSPTFAPSEDVTKVPSGEGTSSPTFTKIPSATPTTNEPSTMVPTMLPSSSPTEHPSTSPTASPTLALQDFLVDIDMVFDDLSLVSGRTIIDFESVTAEHIRTQLVKLGYLADIQVRTNIKNQAAIPSIRRRLAPLQITLDAAVTFRSANTYDDIVPLIGGTFNSDVERALYVNSLKESGVSSFSSINTVQVFVNGEAPEEEKGMVPANEKKNLSIFIIVGAAAGGVAVLILAGLFVCRKKKSTGALKGTLPFHDSQKTSPTNAGLLSQDIIVDNQDDISTLEDPTYAGGMMHMAGGSVYKDDTLTVTNSVDYDYTKAYGAMSPNNDNSLLGPAPDLDPPAVSSSSSEFGIDMLDSSLFSAETSFEEQFSEMEDRIEVMAPAGKLGMVIDTPAGGVPIVHAIKESSVLAKQVQVGDRLVSVDDEDTTGMTAMQVSKLISLRADSDSRTLVFVRNKPRRVKQDP